MEETIDYAKVVHQLQVENEILRNHMKSYAEVRAVVLKVPDVLQELWGKIEAHKYRIIGVLTMVYCVLSILFLFYDRFWGHA